MTTSEMQKVAAMQNLKKTGNLKLPDELNPTYLFNSTFTDLLVLIANGRIDAKQLAKEQLKNRGLNLDGKWVGFKTVNKL